MCTKKTEFIEVKHGGRLPASKDRCANLPNAASQVVGGLHFLATAKIVKEVMKGSGDIRLPICFKIKGLLVKRKDQMTLYTVDVNLASVSSAAVMLRYQDLHAYGSASVTMAHLCSGVTKLTLD